MALIFLKIHFKYIFFRNLNVLEKIKQGEDTQLITQSIDKQINE